MFSANGGAQYIEPLAPLQNIDLFLTVSKISKIAFMKGLVGRTVACPLSVKYDTSKGLVPYTCWGFKNSTHKLNLNYFSK